MHNVGVAKPWPPLASLCSDKQYTFRWLRPNSTRGPAGKSLRDVLLLCGIQMMRDTVHPQVYINRAKQFEQITKQPQSSHHLNFSSRAAYTDVTVLFKESDGCERAQWSS